MTRSFILFLIFCITLPCSASASPCSESLSHINSEALLEKIANRYLWLPKKRAAQFKQDAKQMGFTEENIIEMLKDENFMYYVFYMPKVIIRAFQKLEMTSVPDVTPGLQILKYLIGLSNDQIMKLVLSAKSVMWTTLFRQIDSILKQKDLLKDLGFSDQEFAELFVDTYTHYGRITTLMFSHRQLKLAALRLQSYGWSQAQIRKLFQSNALELSTPMTIERLFRINDLTLDEKRNILKSAGLTDSTIDLIPNDMMGVRPIDRAAPVAAITLPIVLLHFLLYL